MNIIGQTVKCSKCGQKRNAYSDLHWYISMNSGEDYYITRCPNCGGYISGKWNPMETFVAGRTHNYEENGHKVTVIPYNYEHEDDCRMAEEHYHVITGRAMKKRDGLDNWLWENDRETWDNNH